MKKLRKYSDEWMIVKQRERKHTLLIVCVLVIVFLCVLVVHTEFILDTSGVW